MHESTVVSRQFTEIGTGATKLVFLDERNPRFVLVVSHQRYTIQELLLLIQQEMRSRERCLEFFASMPRLVVKEKWILPLADEVASGSTMTNYVDDQNAPIGERVAAYRKALDANMQPIRSVREAIRPLKDTSEHSSLGEHGVKPADLTPTMRQQVEYVIAEVKIGILRAMESEDDRQGLVPDLRGENFIFDEDGKLHFVDTNQLSNCRGIDTPIMSQGLRDSLVKLACIERRVLGRTGSELWDDQFYVATTSGWRAQAGNEDKAIDVVFT